MDYKNNKVNLFLIISFYLILLISCGDKKKKKKKKIDINDVYLTYYSNLASGKDDLVIMKYPLCLSFDELFGSLKDIDKSSYLNLKNVKLECHFPNLNYESTHIGNKGITLRDTSYTKNRPSENYDFEEKILMFSEPIINNDNSTVLIVEHFVSPSSLDIEYSTLVILELSDSKLKFKDRKMIPLTGIISDK